MASLNVMFKQVKAAEGSNIYRITLLNRKKPLVFFGYLVQNLMKRSASRILSTNAKLLKTSIIKKVISNFTEKRL